jgi:L-ascorbate peroxidase
MTRLCLAPAAWHDSGTYNKDLRTGGANGTIRFDKEITAAPNAGLDSAIKLITKIRNKYPEVSWADLYQMGSAAAITVCSVPLLTCAAVATLGIANNIAAYPRRLCVHQ